MEVEAEFPTADVVSIARHLPTRGISSYLHVGPPPAHPGQAQTFMVEVVVRRGGQERRVSAGGRDIYAFSAPLAGEAVTRILDGRTAATGLVTAGTAFDAGDFLRALPLDHLAL
ncbi:hypothetical protein GCM10010435_72640 [Winogradskya consettensis]|uniref:Uncharacterized protein n=1 Tax=Winogradskya consettensis TaxID=113560 RepID=A0A919W0C0_9ACTN|nr:hypothetical protein [Actinoplanes consettensis]GIM83632.1 hypothetical protein Aco04nite_87530 [Actinoplanes consettensis]